MGARPVPALLLAAGQKRRQLEIPALTSLHDPGFKPHPTLRTLAEDHDKMLPDRHANLAGGHDANVAFALAMLMAPGLRVLMYELLILDEFDLDDDYLKRLQEVMEMGERDAESNAHALERFIEDESQL